MILPARREKAVAHSSGSTARVGAPGHYRCVGIGAGPANLSLASLLHSYPDMSNLFLEQKDDFGWHDGQQVPRASLQVSFCKDLVEPDIRRTLIARHVLTSDGISEATLREIYQRSYVHRFVEGNADLLSLLPNKSVTAVAENGIGGWDITIQDNDRTDLVDHVDADVVIWATGFRSADMDFLDPIAPRLERAGHEYRIDQDFAV